MKEQLPNPISMTQAWLVFDKWKTKEQEIGVMFFGCSGTLCTTATLLSAKDGRLRFRAESASASFNLKDATFGYGPVQMFPRWPLPPPVDVIAVTAYLANGDWLVLAEGYRPESLSPLQLPS